MLDGNLQAQINYSMVKALAKAFDEKASILINAEENFEPENDETFAEVAMPEIEAMAKAIVEGCVDFQKFVFGRLAKRQKLPGKKLRMKMGKLFSVFRMAMLLTHPERGTVCFQILRRLKHG